jgi:hypothetical protein
MVLLCSFFFDVALNYSQNFRRQFTLVEREYRELQKPQDQTHRHSTLYPLEIAIIISVSSF